MTSLQDEIILRHDGPTEKSLLVFFITGNPGLIGYYETFLTLIYQSLRLKHGGDHSLEVYGKSLAGFEINNSPNARKGNSNNNNDGRREHGPWDLEQQIQHIDQALTARASSPSTRVVLIGHSVGSYILLEVLRRRKALASPSKIISGICLFPTVTHIARSPSGRKFTLLSSSIPHFPAVVGFLASALFSWLPTPTLQRMTAIVTGQPAEAAHVTAAFLQTQGAVKQALFLAQHEMKTITADRWDDELWGAAVAQDAAAASRSMSSDSNSKNTAQTKMFFLFGTGDHWVADETRDELIAARAGRDEAGPGMEIDESGIPHGFCIKHNEPVAKKVVGYIDQVLAAE